MSHDDEPCHTIRSEDLAGFVAQAVETFLGHVVTETYAATRPRASAITSAAMTSRRSTDLLLRP